MSAKDVGVLYNCNRTTAYRKLDKMKKHFNKPENGEITIYDFSAFTGIPLELLIKCVGK